MQRRQSLRVVAQLDNGLLSLLRYRKKLTTQWIDKDLDIGLVLTVGAGYSVADQVFATNELKQPQILERSECTRSDCRLKISILFA